MNTEQIIKALECCGTREGDCENCPLDKATTMNCQWVLLSLCLDVIKEQQAEIDTLTIQRNAWIITAKLAEGAAIIKMQERLKELAFPESECGWDCVYIRQVDGVAKEMLEKYESEGEG